MALSKARKRAKVKRREFKNRIKNEKVAKRMFFVKLEESVAKHGCDGTLKLAEALLVAMGYKNILSEIKELLEEKGGYCSCEILYNVYPKLYIDSCVDDMEMY